MKAEEFENQAEDTVLVLRFEDDNLVMIEDEEEFNRVVAHLEQLEPESEEAVGDDEDEESEYDDAVITLEDEDGSVHDFIVVDIIEVEGKEYALLTPAEGGEGED